ncbi:MAG: cytochrome c [Deltaproteobacteria bacterium]|nr:cytochrome c [Deltaproteobacteria bacterium]MCW5808002.1 cytochrome c [Deltaproteobacteria bacterium]
MWRFALASLALAACQRSSVEAIDPAMPSARAPTEKQLARGAYVARISGCTVCHATTRPGQIETFDTLGGGAEDTLASGETYRAPNISSDRETGVGAWLPEQIVAAVRTGTRPDGARLLSAMPYREFHRMTDADAYAVAAYLRSQVPVWNVMKRNDRREVHGPALPPPIGNIDPDDAPGHGRYLAALMHCGSCHTAPDGPAFAGGKELRLVDGGEIVAPNITSDADTGIGAWTEAQIIAAVRTMTKPDGSPIEGPMARYAGAWALLSDADARALAAYVKSLRPVRTDGEQVIESVSSRP